MSGITRGGNYIVQSCLTDAECSWRNPWHGIYITSIRQPETGGIVAIYCDICRSTTFIHSPYACKPERGDYWQYNGCLLLRHNMEQWRKEMLGEARDSAFARDHGYSSGIRDRHDYLIMSYSQNHSLDSINYGMYYGTDRVSVLPRYGTS